MADVIKNELRHLRENGNLPMNSESKQAKQINSLWNVSLNTGLDKTAMVAAFPKSPQIPTMIDKMPSHTSLQDWEAVNIPRQSFGSNSLF